MNFEDVLKENFDQILEIGFNEIKQKYQQVTIANAVNCFHSKNTQEDAIYPLAICYSLLKKMVTSSTRSPKKELQIYGYLLLLTDLITYPNN